MLFFYTRYEHILGSKIITATLKNKEQAETFDLYIITPAVKFLGLPIGGGMVKMSRLYTTKGELIHARSYSKELKEEVKSFKKTLRIPYLKLWMGYLVILSIAIVGSIIYGVKMNRDAELYHAGIAEMATALQNIQEGQLYGASFFTDENGESMDGLPSGWIRIEKIEGDTLFVKRSLAIVRDKALFKMDDIASIKPMSEAAWNDKIEKINYALLKEDLAETGKQGFDLIYIGADYEKYRGVIMRIKGV